MSATPKAIPEPQRLILIVDDTPLNISAISGALKDSYKTKIATNGEKALAIASLEEKPDLILLDIMMPGIDGYEVCKRLKANPATREIPVIFLTGQTDDQDETRGFEVGAVDYVHKPFSPAVVKARVQSHILLREAHAQLAAQLLVLNNELEMARQIQLSILPHDLPQLPGLDISVKYQPMTSVAGDFYDFIRIDDQHLGVFIADVSGHGLPSALIASMLQVALSGQTTHAREPAEVLRGLNRALCGKFAEKFVTAVYLYLDLENKLIRYAGAGHPPVLQWNKHTGRTAQLLENGLVLGMVEEATYNVLDLPLQAGDRFFLYTDGVPEASNRLEEEFGVQRLVDYIKKNNEMDANRFSEALLEELSRWTEYGDDRGQQDDITLMVIDFLPSSR